MIIILSGYPKSGKTVFALKFIEDLDITYISQDLFQPDNIDELSEEEQMEIGISSWQCSEDYLFEKLETDDIIYDTCGSNRDQLRLIYKKAKEYNHKIVFIYIHSPINDCVGRGTDRQLCIKYKNRFKDILVTMRKKSDDFIIVKNKGSIDDLLTEAVNARSRIYKREQISGTD